MITEEEKREAVKLAMKIDVGAVSPFIVVEIFDRCPDAAAEIMRFWLGFNDMTREVAELIGIERCRKHLESCYRKDFECLKNQNLKPIQNGLKQALYGAKAYIIGVLKDIVEL